MLGLVGVLLFADGGAANYGGTLDATNRTELRLRDARGDTNAPAFDFVDSALVRLTLSDRRWDYFVSYQPVFTAPYLFQSGTQSGPLFMQGGSVGIRWRDRRVRLALTEDGTYGKENTALLGTVTTGSDGRPPATQIAAAPLETITVGYSRTALAADWDLSRTLHGYASVAYIIQGGLDFTSRQQVPIEEGPRLDATLSDKISRIDTLETRLTAQASESTYGVCPAVIASPSATTPTIDCDPSAVLVFAVESWRHRIARNTETAVGVGFSAMASKLGASGASETALNALGYGSSTSTLADPVFEASITHQDGPRKSVRLELQVEPFIDVRSGTADYRAQLGGILDLPVGPRQHVRAQLFGMQSIDTLYVPPLSLVRSDVLFEDLVSPAVGIGVGAGAQWQYQLTYGPSDSAYISLAVILHAPTVRF